MTKKDLKILFTQETGKYTPDTLPSQQVPITKIANSQEYIIWLEDRVIALYNNT